MFPILYSRYYIRWEHGNTSLSRSTRQEEDLISTCVHIYISRLCAPRQLWNILYNEPVRNSSSCFSIFLCRNFTMKLNCTVSSDVFLRYLLAYIYFGMLSGFTLNWYQCIVFVDTPGRRMGQYGFLLIFDQKNTFIFFRTRSLFALS